MDSMGRLAGQIDLPSRQISCGTTISNQCAVISEFKNFSDVVGTAAECGIDGHEHWESVDGPHSGTRQSG